MTPPTTTPPRSSQEASAPGRLVFDLPLEHGLTAPAAARHAARPVLASWGLSQEQVYDLLVVISELVTNAVTHALPPVVLHLQASHASGKVQVRVDDGGPQPTPAGWAACRPADEHGRGTLIVAALTYDTPDDDEDLDDLIDRWADATAA
ncbi:ATP-binding protein [Streptomyces djakartensis]|uniref:ATP-binding protein n=1 Tax=Streptomyces djakartensis TaxID=68193 RepID=UPI0034DE7C2D